MDSITHTVLGACTGELIAGKKIGKKAMLIGALANNVPDLDMVSQFWTTEAQGLLTHRGLTHSVFFAVLIMPVLIPLFRLVFRKINLPYTTWIYLVGHGLLLHILMDSFTTYGTGWWEPFSHYRVSFNLLFILDPFILILFLIGTVTLLVMRPCKPQRSTVAAVFLSIGVCYLGLVTVIKLHVQSKVREVIAAKKIPVRDYMFCPTPLNCVLWYMNIKTDEGFYTGYYSVFDKSPVEVSEHPAHKELIAGYEHDPEVQALVRFTKGYYALEQKPDRLVMYDTRFGQTKVDPNAPFFFAFDIFKNQAGIEVKQAEFRKMESEDIKLLYQRVKGN